MSIAPTTNKPSAVLIRPAATRPTLLMLRYMVPVATVHLLALTAVIPALFSWTGLIAALVGVHVFGQSITMGYHRLLAHRSFQTHRWVEYSLVVLALFSLEDSPARWVATHRKHHAHSDEEHDPHSPLVAFLWGHMGWLFLNNRDLHHRTNYERFARDILRDPFYMWLEKNAWSPVYFYAAQCALYWGVAFGAGLIWMPLAGALLFATSVLVWGVFVRTVLVWHITWSVNSFTHLFGYQTHSTGENSRNNWFVALIAAGEGWHNNHHSDPPACSLQQRWWEFDLTYWELRVMKWMGLVIAIVPPRQARLDAVAAKENRPRR